MPQAHSQKRYDAYRALYDAGWLDREIGEAFGFCQQVVSKWRRENELPSNFAGPRIDRDIASKMYADGMSDGEIARALGVTQSGVTRWRQRRGLAPNYAQPGLTDSQRRSAKKLLRQGQTKGEVSAAVGCSKSTIQRLRRGMNPDGLRKHSVSNAAIACQTRKDANILPRIERAIGRHLPEHIREDAVSDLYVAVLSGEIAVDQIESRAASYRNKAWEMCGSAFGAARLDEEDENGRRLIDRIADPSTLDYA